MIDWADPKIHISKFFTVKDALWLPKWNRLATVKDGLTPEIQANLILLLDKMDVVRNFLDTPIISHVTFRPRPYNKLVKGAKNSAHLYGMAMDWHGQGISCDEVRTLIVPLLETWGMRCERGDNLTWVHLDYRDPPPGGNRYFFP